jgi:hypothetical protein
MILLFVILALLLNRPQSPFPTAADVDIDLFVGRAGAGERDIVGSGDNDRSRSRLGGPKGTIPPCISTEYPRISESTIFFPVFSSSLTLLFRFDSKLN